MKGYPLKLKQMKFALLTKIVFIFALLFTLACSKKKKDLTVIAQKTLDFKAELDTIWRTEQEPLTMRDSLMKIYGVESKEAQFHQKIYKENHILNEVKVKKILDKYGWPTKEMIGEQGNLTICNVIQHSDNDIRLKYLPLMKKAVKDKKLEPRFLVRAEDRIATESGDLQIYGGQMKYYPATKSFNVWPVYDPTNIDKRRAEIGLEPIAEYLKNRFDFTWDLEEQMLRSKAFEKEKITE